MSIDYLDFEQPIAELEEKIAELRRVGDDNDLGMADDIHRLEDKNQKLTKQIFAKLTDWQIAQIARHALRPHTSDYISRIFDDYVPLAGDRAYANDWAIEAGMARLDGQSVMVIGHEKGRNTNEKIKRNFGMPRPEGYRKALRLMKLAERFAIPVITFVDTPGAYPGIGAEERGQSEAIAVNLREMAHVRVPIITVVIGEGGSGGALAISVADKILMLQYSIYSVISPEGCAAILWKNADKAPEAAEALALTAKKLESLAIVDGIIDEPLGGAHRAPNQMAAFVKERLVSELAALRAQPVDTLLQSRYQKILNYGQFQESALAG